MAENESRKENERTSIWSVSKIEDVPTSQRNILLRRQLFALLEFTRSRDLRDRVGGLSFGDMIQETIERIDSDREGSFNKTTALSPLREHRPGKLQRIAQMMSVANSTFAAAEEYLKNDEPRIFGAVEGLEDELANDPESQYLLTDPDEPGVIGSEEP